MLFHQTGGMGAIDPPAASCPFDRSDCAIHPSIGMWTSLEKMMTCAERLHLPVRVARELQRWPAIHQDTTTEIRHWTSKALEKAPFPRQKTGTTKSNRCNRGTIIAAREPAASFAL